MGRKLWREFGDTYGNYLRWTDCGPLQPLRLSRLWNRTGANSFISATGGSGTPDDPYFINVIARCTKTFGVAACLSSPGSSTIDWAWSFTKSFFGGFTIFGPENDPRPSCFGTFLKDTARNFAGVPNIDTAGTVAAGHYAISQLHPSPVPSSRALRGGLSAKKWIARNEAKQVTRSGAVGLLVNADLAMSQALWNEVGTVATGNCK